MKEFLEKNQQTTKSDRGVEKYYVFILLGYQSIHDKYELAHEMIYTYNIYIKSSFIHACTAFQLG